MSLFYEIEIQKAEEGGFVVSIPALPGCITQVEEWEEAYHTIETIRREWIRIAYEDGVDIPLPRTEKEYSGKFVLRIPKSMHRNLDKAAEEEGVSLNTLVLSIISQGLGSRNADATPKGADLARKQWEDKWEILMSRPSKESEPPKLHDRRYWESRRF
jgi:antitoxin HicB